MQIHKIDMGLHYRFYGSALSIWCLLGLAQNHKHSNFHQGGKNLVERIIFVQNGEFSRYALHSTHSTMMSTIYCILRKVHGKPFNV